MRVLLFTGKGGVGKTTVAAATAAHAALRGTKTLVLSTDPAHSLADVLGVAIGPEPTDLGDGLFGQQVAPQRRFGAAWAQIRDWLVGALGAAGVEPAAAAELAVLPGADEVLALLELRQQVASGDWDLVVVDCAPTGETLRLLALPEVIRWYAERLFPLERRLARALRPALGRVPRGVLPQEQVVDAVVRLQAELADARQLLADPERSSVRLVVTPESVVLAEARRTLTMLALHGYRVDGVVANRMFPGDGDDPWRSSWAAAQQERLARACADVAPLVVREVAHRPAEPVGRSSLLELAEGLYGDADPADHGPAIEPLRVDRTDDGYLLSQALPLADRAEVSLQREGDELVVGVGDHRRSLALPAVLRRCTVEGAVLRDGRLQVRFAPDPALWLHP